MIFIMKKSILFIALVLLFACENKGKKVVKEPIETEEVAEAKVENVMIKGTVFSANDSTPLASALIILPGTTTGTISTTNGEFQISIPEGSKKILFAMDGYEKSVAEISPNRENKIYLMPKSN